MENRDPAAVEHTYVEQAGDPATPPPYAFEGLQSRNLLLAAEQDRLSALCDRFLNLDFVRAAGLSYEPLAGLVFLQLNSYRKIYSNVEPFRSQGFARQEEILFGFPVVRSRDGQYDGIAFFFPFAFVDNPWSVVAGREVLGFPKVQAKIRPSPEGGWPYEAATWVLAEYGATTELARRGFLSASRDARRESPLENRDWWPLGPVEKIYGKDGLCPVDAEALAFVEQLADMDAPVLPIVLLRQYRDAVDVARAAYQAQVYAHMAASDLRSIRLLPGVRVALKAYDSLPIAETLGLVGVDGEFEPFLGFTVDIDGELAVDDVLTRD